MKMISNIVFTKNRPLQLDAYMQSLYRYFPAGLIQTYVIYKLELFDRQYQQLYRKYSDCIVIKENDFHTDFLRTLSRINTRYILFGIDDVVFFDTVDFDVIDRVFGRFSRDVFGFSLRFGQESAEFADDTINKTTVAGQTVYSIDWTKGRSPTTRYPFELCATIYPTALIKKIIDSVMNNNPAIKKLFSPGSFLIKTLGQIVSTRSILKSFGYFFSPNTLESWNCRWCQNNGDQLPHCLYFQKLCAAAIQVNMVNTSTRGRDGTSVGYTVEALNEKFKLGYRLDIKFIAENKPDRTQGGRQYFKVTKNSD